MNPVERAAAALSAGGFRVYRAGEAAGPCREPYLTVYDGGLRPAAGRAGVRVIGVLVLVPLGRAEALAPLAASVSAILLERGLRAEASRGESIDEALRAHVLTMEFAALCAMR